jgi:hypothetical protein
MGFLLGGRADAGGTLTIPRALAYLAGELRSEWKPNTITMKACWRVTHTQISSYGYSRYPNYPYVLDDRTQQTSVAAGYVPGP